VTYRTALLDSQRPDFVTRDPPLSQATSDKRPRASYSPDMYSPPAQIQIDGMEMFEDRVEIIKVFHEATVVEIFENPAYYEEKIRVLKTMLKFIEPYYGPQNLAAELEENPYFDNNVFDLYGYAFYEGREYIHKREIDEYLAILSVKMDEYDKFVLLRKVEFGVIMALIMSG
jgi:hypothetical protein